MTPPEREKTHKSVAILRTDTVGRSFHSGRDPHHPDPSTKADQGEMQTMTRSEQGRSEDDTRMADASLVSHVTVHTVEGTNEHRATACAGMCRHAHHPEPPLRLPRRSTLTHHRQGSGPQAHSWPPLLPH